MIAPEDINAGFDRGELTWWTVSVYGHGQGVVLTGMRAVHRALDLWDISSTCCLRVTAAKTSPETNHAWPGVHAMHFDSAGCLELLSQDGYATFQLAREAAVASYQSNSREIVKQTNDHVAENTRVIEQLLAAQPSAA